MENVEKLITDEQIENIRNTFVKFINGLKRIWENVKNTFIKIYTKVFKNNKELRKLLNIRKRVKSKRLKKKYDKKIRQFVFNMI